MHGSLSTKAHGWTPRCALRVGCFFEVTNSPLAHCQCHKGLGRDLQADGLLPGRHYRVRVRASNICGWGPWSEPLPCTTAPGVPGPPPMLAAKAVGTSVRAAWEAAEDNGAIVLAYELEMASVCDGRFATVFRGESLSHRVQQLDVSAAYHFRVRAENAGEYGGRVSMAILTRTILPVRCAGVHGDCTITPNCSSITSGAPLVACRSRPGPLQLAGIRADQQGAAATASGCAGACSRVWLQRQLHRGQLVSFAARATRSRLHLLRG